MYQHSFSLKIFARPVLVSAALATCLLSGCITKDMRALGTDSSDAAAILVVAERGASEAAPENTLAAFDKAQDLGALGVRLDVQLSKDGQVVVFADDTLDAKTMLRGNLRDHTWAELASVDLAPWFARGHGTSASAVKDEAAATPQRVQTSGRATAKRTRSSRETELDKYRLNYGARSRSKKKVAKKKTPSNPSLTRLITLDEVFERYGLTFQYYIVLHSKDAALASAVLRLVKEYGIATNAIVASKDYAPLSELYKSAPDLTYCYLIDDQNQVDAELQRAVTLGFGQIGVRTAVVTASQVKRARSVNIRIFAFDAATDDQIVNAAKIGVAAVASTAPERAAKAIENASKLRY